MKSLLAVVANNSIATTMVFVKSRPRLFFFQIKNYNQHVGTVVGACNRGKCRFMIIVAQL